MAEGGTWKTKSLEARMDVVDEGITRFCSSIYSESLPPVTVAQCVEELVQNSVDADAREVEVSIDMRSLRIRIKDDGHGLTMEDLKTSGNRYYCSQLHTIGPNSRHNANFMELCDRQSFISCLINCSSSVQIISKSSLNSTGLSYLKAILNGKFTEEIIEIEETVFNKSGLIMDFQNLFSQNGAQKKDISNTSEMEHIKHYLELICLMNQHLSVKVMDEETGNIIFKVTSQRFSPPYLYEGEKKENPIEVENLFQKYCNINADVNCKDENVNLQQQQSLNSVSFLNLNVSGRSFVAIGSTSKTNVIPISKTYTNDSNKILESDLGPSIQIQEKNDLLQEEKSTEHNFLASGNTPELLEIILDKLDSLSLLKSCRGVNSLWNEISTNLLFKRDELKVSFLFDEERNAFILSNKKGKNKTKWKLSTLTELLSQATIYEKQFEFPCTTFTLKGGQLPHLDLQWFFFKHGKIIKKLHIDIFNRLKHLSTSESECITYFRTLLMFYLPNLEVLKVDEFPHLWFNAKNTSELFPDLNHTQNQGECRPLSKLKKLYFMENPPKKIFDDLLRVGQNIQDAGFDYFCDSEMCNWLLEENKIHLLRFLVIQLDDKNVDAFDYISNQTLFLKTLDIYAGFILDDQVEYLPRIAQVMYKLLKSTSRSLAELHLNADSMGISAQLLQIPVMHNLRHFHLLSDEGSIEIFPHSFQLFDNLPSLESYESDVINCDQWATVFEIEPSSRPLLTMKKIHFENGPPNDWVEKCPRMFPNLKIVQFGLIKNFPRVSGALWNLANMETLAFELNVNEENHRFPAMDAAFTGFSKETCLNLFEKSVDVNVDVDPIDFDGWRESNSILDVKSLRRLHITLYDFSKAKKTLTWRFISHVTGIFAFQMCPQLRVSIRTFADKRDNERVLRNGLKLSLPFVDTKIWQISS